MPERVTPMVSGKPKFSYEMNKKVEKRFFIRK